MRMLAFLTDPPVVSAILLHLDLPHKPPPLSPARGPPQSDLLTGLLDQTPAFDPAEPEPIPDQRFASVPSSSTSPRPTTSISEAPESGRPAGDAPPRGFPAHPRISPAHYHTLSSPPSLATLSRPRRPPPPRLPCSASSPRAPSHLASSHERPFELPIRCRPSATTWGLSLAFGASTSC
jgi:hypothetical protein